MNPPPIDWNWVSPEITLSLSSDSLSINAEGAGSFIRFLRSDGDGPSELKVNVILIGYEGSAYQGSPKLEFNTFCYCYDLFVFAEKLLSPNDMGAAPKFIGSEDLSITVIPFEETEEPLQRLVVELGFIGKGGLDRSAPKALEFYFGAKVDLGVLRSLSELGSAIKSFLLEIPGVNLSNPLDWRS